MVFLTWDEAVDLAESIHERYHALIYLAVDSGMRWSELVGLRRAKVDLRRRKVRVTEQLIRLESKEWLRKEPKTPAGSPLYLEFFRNGRDSCRAPGPVCRARARRTRVPEQGGTSADLVELLAGLLPSHVGIGRLRLPVP